MEYATALLVQKEFKSLQFSASGLAETTVDEWIIEESEYINARIALKYQVPILVGTSPLSFKVLQQICIWLVTKRIQETLEVKTTVPEGQQIVVGGDKRTLAEARLDKILDGTLVLTDAISSGSEQGVSSFSVDSNVKHVFQKGDPRFGVNDQW